MSGRQSAIVDKALREVARGSTAYAAAKKQGIALSTIYRALKRERDGILMGAAGRK
jgi:DNA-binding phage protein